jgi:hypothetical protein
VITEKEVFALSSGVTEKKRLWEPKREEICEKEFEETRRCLLNSYHSYVQTHAGYIIALVIGLFSLISRFDAFIKSDGWTVAFVVLVIATILVALYMVCRIFYWTSYATHALFMPIDEAIRLFKEHNRKPDVKTPYLEESPAPYTAILQMAISEKRTKKRL